MRSRGFERTLLVLALVSFGALAPLAARADAIRDAERAIAHGRYDAALTALNPLVKRERPRALALSGQIHQLRGERAEADAAFRALVALYNRGAIQPTDGEGLWALAEATRALGAYRDANSTFARAVEASPERVEIELAWADLFSEKHALAEAQTSVQRALARTPEHPGALERMARLELERAGDFAKVETLLSRALAKDPELTAAYVTRAGVALRDEELALADRHLDAALRINPHDLEALSVRAAVRFLADDVPGFERAVSRVLAENPHFSRLYSIVATYVEWEHRYAELVALSDAALRIDPEDAYAHATRGINLLRLGREDEGLAALKAAWARDHYNAQVFNLLELYERTIAQEYESFDAPPFRLRMQRKERPLLASYALPLVLRAHAALVARYHFTPAAPTHIELFASPKHFAIRATGLPQLGIQGICFGNVVTALSPRGGEFNWGQILWHELSHVFHVQLSKGRVPRWFTEGLAEYETELARPEWKREDDRPLYDELARGELPSLLELNRAFTHAKNPEALMVAYYASSRVVAYLAQRFGFDAIVRMLALWGENLSTPEVIRRALAVEPSVLDREVRAALFEPLARRYAHDLRVDLSEYEDLARWRQCSAARGASAEDHAGLALALAESGELDAAAARAQALLADHPDVPVARFTLVHVALKKGDMRSAKHELDALIERGQDGYQLRMLRARIAIAGGDARAALPELAAAIQFDAERTEAYSALAEVARLIGDDAELERALTRLSELDQHTRGPLLRLLALLRRRGAYPELVARAESGLYRDVHSYLFHLALADGLLHTGRLQEARVEAERALTLASGDERRDANELRRAIEDKLRRARAGTPPAPHTPSSAAPSAPPSSPRIEATAGGSR